MVKRFLLLVVYVGLLVIALGVMAYGVTSYGALTRGIEGAAPAAKGGVLVGTNVALEQYGTDADLARAFGTLKDLRVTAARQYFPWREIEAARGVYDWAKWDRIVAAARANEMPLVAVLTTAPAWSQRPNEVEMPNAPPNDFGEFARFAGEFAKRYGDRIEFYQIWDEPNVEPNWGKRNADPVEYAQLLIPAAEAIRANDADAKILTGGLAMNLEVHRPHPNYSEILFLRGLYEVGANKAWDIVAAKPYGMWTGPEDRTVNSGVLNFSRLILLRDEMLHYGERDKPIWAVEMGWNALPAGWTGAASPWGTDAAEVQTERLRDGLARVSKEWIWLTGMFPLYLQPNVAADNPRWGFALLTLQFEPTGLYRALATFMASGRIAATPPMVPFLPTVLLVGVALVAAWRSWHFFFTLNPEEHWRGVKLRARALPEPVQVVVVAAAAAAFYWSSNVALNFVLMVVLVLLFALRMDLGIALTVLTIPFWNFPKTLFGGFQLAPIEAFTWIATVAMVADLVAGGGSKLGHWRIGALGEKGEARSEERDEGRFAGGIWNLVGRLSAIDWAVGAFFVLGLVSTQWAGNFGVASREFRIVILDATLLYALVRLTGSEEGRFARKRLETKDEGRTTRWIVWALLASGVVVCVIGLYQYVTGDVIVADGIGRLTSVWGSPNNVGLYLGRLLPIALAFVFLGDGGWRMADGRRQTTDERGRMKDGVGKDGEKRETRNEKGGGARLRENWVRVVCAGLVGLFGVTILLTFSRGALFVGVPASVVCVLGVLFLRDHKLSRRAWLVIGGAAVVAGIAIVPFLFSERIGSLATGFTRIAVWTSAVHMIRDHPLLGVGLDNFLYEYPKYILPSAWAEPNLSHPHNFVLDFWSRLGIGGLAIFVWMLVAFYKRGWFAFTTTRDMYTRALMLGLMASVVAMLAHGLIDASFFVVDLAFVFLLTLALVQREGKPNPPAPLP